MDIMEWRKKLEGKKPPHYAHFDYRTTLDKTWDYFTNPEKVRTHGFYPFIHFTIEYRKFKKNKKDTKIRSVYYSANLDGFIYKYYSYLLNEAYNLRAVADGINEVSVAYRTNLHKSNIHFAHEAFEFIRSTQSCHVMIGDFTDFFDSLDHRYLKERLCNLLGVTSLSPDYYAVYKSITRFSYWELNDLLEINGLKETVKDRRTLNKKARVLSSNEFDENRHRINRNKNPFGIPQGSPISAVLANIYMLAVDKEMNDYVKQHGGFYMRYSDDFIIILPDKGLAFSEHYKWIKETLSAIPKLELQDKKTKLFCVYERTVMNCTKEYASESGSDKKMIDFLGFTFNGSVVTIRDKTLSKYYYRMYRKIKTITQNDGYTKTGKRISCQNLYEKYSYKGAAGPKGNFLSYVARAKKEFGCSEAIDRSTKYHMQKIRKRLNS